MGSYNDLISISENTNSIYDNSAQVKKETSEENLSSISSDFSDASVIKSLHALAKEKIPIKSKFYTAGKMKEQDSDFEEDEEISTSG